MDQDAFCEIGTTFLCQENRPPDTLREIGTAFLCQENRPPDTLRINIRDRLNNPRPSPETLFPKHYRHGFYPHHSRYMSFRSCLNC